MYEKSRGGAGLVGEWGDLTIVIKYYLLRKMRKEIKKAMSHPPIALFCYVIPEGIEPSTD